MKQSLKSLPKSKPPNYANTPEEQTMLYWRLQQQRNGREIPGYVWNVRDSLQTLNRIAEDFALPLALRNKAHTLNHEIITAARPKKSRTKQTVIEIFTLQQ